MDRPLVQHDPPMPREEWERRVWGDPEELGRECVRSAKIARRWRRRNALRKLLGKPALPTEWIMDQLRRQAK